MNTPRVRTPELQRANNAHLIEQNVKIYTELCNAFGLRKEEMMIVENSIAIEKMIRVITDKKYQRKRMKKMNDAGKSLEEVESVFCRVVKFHEPGKVKPDLVKTTRARVFSILEGILGKDLDKASVLGKRMGFSAMFLSNLNEVLYQRGKNQLRGKSSAETFTLSQGASLEARFRPIMDKHLGVATVVGSIKNILQSIDKRTYLATTIRKPGAEGGSWTPMERDLSLLERKVFPGPLKSIVKKIPTLDKNEKNLALNLITEASLLLKPQITHKMIMPWCMWKGVVEHCQENNLDLSDFAAYSGQRAFRALQIGSLRSLIIGGMGIVGDANIAEDPVDKIQALMMGCLGAAYEDINIIETMIGAKLKRRYQMKVGNFGPEEGTVHGARISFTHWAEFGNRLPFSSGGSGESKQISNSGVFLVERQSTTNLGRLQDLINRESGDAGEPLSSLVAKVRAQIEMVSAKQRELREFLGGYLYRMDDDEKKNPITFERSGTSFFFEFTASDVKRTGAKRRREERMELSQAGSSGSLGQKSPTQQFTFSAPVLKPPGSNPPTKMAKTEIPTVEVQDVDLI
uniref:Nucleoprotein n=1 Tax=Ornate chorus frog influenza-like virus TaxID=2777033 RepID=A0A866VUA3_9ORTO|nr:nucleoprotein [Ornate chorus frog influenza-like virus]